MRVDDGRADRCVEDTEREVEQERALARSGRADDRHMAGEAGHGQPQRAVPRLADRQRRTARDARRRRRQRSLTRQARGIEVCVGQTPELRQLPVTELETRRGRYGTLAQLPLDPLLTIPQRRRELGERGKHGLGVGLIRSDHLEYQADLEADSPRPLSLLGLALERRQRRLLRAFAMRSIEDRVEDVLDGVGRDRSTGRFRGERPLPCLGSMGRTTTRLRTSAAGVEVDVNSEARRDSTAGPTTIGSPRCRLDGSRSLATALQTVGLSRRATWRTSTPGSADAKATSTSRRTSRPASICQ